MKKKGIIITIIVLLVLIIAGLVTKYIDTANVSTGHEPECCIKIVSQDGGKVTYWGLGYKVVRYVGVSPNEPYESNIGVKMGSWFMNYEKPTNVILDVKSFGTNNTFQISEKEDVDFITNLLKHSKYTDEPCDGIIDYAITYDNDTYNILISCSEINRSGKQATISDEDMKKLEKILANADEENSGYKTLKIIDGAESGNLILAGAETTSVYSLDANKVDILVNGNKAELKNLEDGMPIDIYYEGDFDNINKKMGAVVDITSWCKSINGHTIGTQRNPGGSFYDLSGLYLKVLEDLWEVDAGLNGGIKYISIDLSEAPGELTEGEKAAISYVFTKAHNAECLQLSFDELRVQGYIKKDELYWEDGLLFSITDSMKAEEQYNGLRVIKFDAQKWRSGTGAYYFGDCTASWPQNGTWSDYNIGSQAIS